MCVIYFILFFQCFVQYTLLHPLKDLPNSESGDDIICKSVSKHYSEQRYWYVLTQKLAT